MKNNQLEKRLLRYLPLSQAELKQETYANLISVGYQPVSADGYLYAEGDTPILLVAHLDTVYKERVIANNIKTLTLKQAYEKEKNESEKTTNGWGAFLGAVHYGTKQKKTHTIHYTGDISNNYSKLEKAGYDTFLQCDGGIGGDDRCGVAIITHLASKLKKKPYILFLEDEEIGCIGAGKFAKVWNKHLSANDINFIVELDRGEFDNVVFYDCANEEFEQFITDFTGYELEYGTCSDISTIAPAIGVAACNITCGYYNEHNGSKEMICLEQVVQTAEVVEGLVDCADELVAPFEYVDAYDLDYGVYPYHGGYGGKYHHTSMDDIYDMLDRIDVLETTVKNMQEQIDTLNQIVRGY